MSGACADGVHQPFTRAQRQIDARQQFALECRDLRRLAVVARLRSARCCMQIGDVVHHVIRLEQIDKWKVVRRRQPQHAVPLVTPLFQPRRKPPVRDLARKR
jgi:hypothetical protein